MPAMPNPSRLKMIIELPQIRIVFSVMYPKTVGRSVPLALRIEVDRTGCAIAGANATKPVRTCRRSMVLYCLSPIAANMPATVLDLVTDGGGLGPNLQT